MQSLGSFYYEHRWIDDVLRMVKAGKEANVYLCTSGPGLTAGFIAAKVYRPRMLRNLKNDHLYREGREDLDSNGAVIFDSRELHAMRKKTAFGKELLHTSWLEHEFNTLKLLHAAGADVPQPLACDNNAMLMGYIGDEQVPAPTLNSVHLPRDEARFLYKRVLRNIKIMLSGNRVHGDLSAFNILYWDGKITLIDFPQAVDPAQNRSAYRIFERCVRVAVFCPHGRVHPKPRRQNCGLFWHPRPGSIHQCWTIMMNVAYGRAHHQTDGNRTIMLDADLAQHCPKDDQPGLTRSQADQHQRRNQRERRGRQGCQQDQLTFARPQVPEGISQESRAKDYISQLDECR
jgi:RIO kinase 1